MQPLSQRFWCFVVSGACSLIRRMLGNGNEEKFDLRPQKAGRQAVIVIELDVIEMSG